MGGYIAVNQRTSGCLYFKLLKDKLNLFYKWNFDWTFKLISKIQNYQ